MSLRKLALHVAEPKWGRNSVKGGRRGLAARQSQATDARRTFRVRSGHEPLKVRVNPCPVRRDLLATEALIGTDFWMTVYASELHASAAERAHAGDSKSSSDDIARRTASRSYLSGRNQTTILWAEKRPNIRILWTVAIRTLEPESPGAYDADVRTEWSLLPLGPCTYIVPSGPASNLNL